MIKFSISSNSSKKIPKLYTYSFKVATAGDLDDLAANANRYAISGPKYKSGHRKGENITAGSNIILIDCDKPGQAEAVESKIQHYDYVKVPSASNLAADYKWHYIVPTMETLSIYPAAMRWQVEQFFRQVGITDAMIDTTGSYDAVRQFAPASIGMTIEEADDLSEINETDIVAPVMPESEIPVELLTAAAKSKSVKIDGIIAAELPAEHLWFKGNAIAYPDAIRAVREAYGTRENDDDKIIVSGFGCPHDNHEHSGDITSGYGFAFVGLDGDVIVKCTGNACKDHPYFTVPEPLEDTKLITVDSFDRDNASEIVKSFEKHWEENLDNISSPALMQNWENNFDAFEEIIKRNQNKLQGKKICCPSVTGSGKTQQIIHKAIDLYGSKIGTLIVTMRNEDADIIAKQIMDSTSADYVAVFHTSEVSIDDVRKAEHPGDTQCLIISHERFRRQENTITNGRDFIVIDEAINVISHNQITEDDLLNMIRVIEKYGNPKNKDLQSELRMMKQILDIQFKAFKDSGRAFKGLRAGTVPKNLDRLPDLIFKASMIFFGNQKLKISTALTGIYNKKMDDALRSKFVKISESMLFYFKQFNFMTRAGKRITWDTASELIPGKSIVIMDATASVNSSYQLYMKYQPERLKVLPAILCRSYETVSLHTVRTATGRNTIIGKSDEVELEDGTKMTASDTLKKLFKNIIKNSNPGDQILFVSFLKIEPEVMTYAENIKDRIIFVNHWGNLTGTNKYQYCNKIFIYGLNHKPENIHRSLHALAKSATESFKETDENQIEMKSLITSDLVAEVIQAINRIRCRRVIDADGNCDTADVYITLPAGYSDSFVMLKAITGEMANIKTKQWNLSEEDGVRLARVYSVESFMRQLDVSLGRNCFEISLDDVLEGINMTRDQYRKNIKNKAAFRDALDASPFFLEKRQAIRERSRGRVSKRREDWFVLGVKK